MENIPIIEKMQQTREMLMRAHEEDVRQLDEAPKAVIRRIKEEHKDLEKRLNKIYDRALRRLDKDQKKVEKEIEKKLIKQTKKNNTQ